MRSIQRFAVRCGQRGRSFATRESPSRIASKKKLLEEVAKLTRASPAPPSATSLARAAAAQQQQRLDGDDGPEDRKRALRGLQLRALIGALVALAVGATLWSKMKKKQMSGWARRVLDTYHLLDDAEHLNLTTVVARGTEERDDAIFRSMERDLGTSELEIASLNDRAFAQPWRVAGIDLCDFFAEGARGSPSVSAREVAHSLTLLRIISATSRDRIYGALATDLHARAMALMRARPGVAAAPNAEVEAATLAAEARVALPERTVDPREVLAWVRGAARAGIVRHNYFASSSGRLLKMESVADALVADVVTKCAVSTEAGEEEAQLRETVSFCFYAPLTFVRILLTIELAPPTVCLCCCASSVCAKPCWLRWTTPCLSRAIVRTSPTSPLCGKRQKCGPSTGLMATSEREKVATSTGVADTLP